MTHDTVPPADRTCPAAVAYDLMRDILLDDPRRPTPSSPEFRPYLLDLYAECLLAVRGKRAAPSKPAVRASTRSPRERRRGETAASPAMQPN
jgi:hypothetical protein